MNFNPDGDYVPGDIKNGGGFFLRAAAPFFLGSSASPDKGSIGSSMKGKQKNQNPVSHHRQPVRVSSVFDRRGESFSSRNDPGSIYCTDRVKDRYAWTGGFVDESHQHSSFIFVIRTNELFMR
jgi:hypothetical protein